MKRTYRLKGLTLIEVAMALAIATLSFLFLARLMADSSSSAQAAADAKKMTMMAKASQTYLSVEAADLKAFITSPTQVVAIPVARNSEGELPPDGPHTTLPSVQKAGLLAAEFIDSNALGQRHVLLVKEPVADKLEGLLVAYGGTEMQDTQLGKLIQSVGMAGGGVFAKDVAPVTATPIANANINGHAGGWTLPVNGWTGAFVGATPVSPTAGRPIVSISMMDVMETAGASESGDFLSRVATADPSDTTMAANLNMGGNQITNASQITSTGQVRAAQFCDVNGLNCLGKGPAATLKTWPTQILCDGNSGGAIPGWTGVRSVFPLAIVDNALTRARYSVAFPGMSGNHVGLDVSSGTVSANSLGGFAVDVSGCAGKTIAQLDAEGRTRY